MSRISVIIPTYNCAEYLWGSVSTLACQIFQPMEIIIVDDGSTDWTSDWKNISMLNGVKIQYIYQPHQNANVARNHGFVFSEGDYVIFCDADGIYYPNMLLAMYQALKNHSDKSFAYSRFYLIEDRKRYEEKAVRPYSIKELRKRNIASTSSLIRREYFLGFDENIERFQDWDLWLSMAEAGYEGIMINKILFESFRRKEGISRRNDFDYWISYVRRKHSLK